ncbi:MULTISPECIES: Clp protease N-terminal domain-containing protein [unclassified Streptosporangium]|uniref:Clp protease N-terminal domain-containing protein n=1 Tax=Streptosporangium sp. NPDC005286 TaxID=3154463 RepID=UPI0033BEDF3F
MFERFTDNARQVTVLAQEEARRLRHGHIGTEHLLLGLLRQGDSVGAQVLTGLGLTHERADEAVGRTPRAGELDAEALETIGIDLDAIREKVEAAFGPGALDRPRDRKAPRGHVPFTPGAKKALELSLREALRLKDKRIGTEHILLGLVRAGAGPGMRVITQAGLTADEVRHEIARHLGRPDRH